MIQFPLQCSNPPEIGLEPIFWSKPVFKEWRQQGIVDSPAFLYSECTVGACFPRELAASSSKYDVEISQSQTRSARLLLVSNSKHCLS